AKAILALTAELLANREAQPVGFYTTVSGRKGVIWHNGAPEDDTAIYTVPIAGREAQPVAGELGEIRVGRLPTMNQEEYPGLGDWWVQMRIGASGDEILARVYGATPDEAVARARALTAPPAPAVPREIPITSPVAAEYVAGWNACRAAMLTEAKCECSSIDYCGDCLRGMMAQPVSSGYKLVPVEPTENMIIDGFESDAFMALADAVNEKNGWPYGCKESAECVEGIFKAMLSAAPEKN
ncbi:hypothetical protein ACB284_27770, partial [Serratia marcescens]